MPATQTAREMLDRNFLEVRHRLLDIAAALDRIDRARNAPETRSDARYLQLERALRVMTDGEPDRSERVQMVFSLPYHEDWRSVLGVNARGCKG